MSRNVAHNNISMAVADLQKQVAALKSQNSITRKPVRSDVIVKCATTEQFKQYDVCKIVDGGAEKFDGTETSSDSYIPGVVVDGNYGSSIESVLVLIDGITYTVVTEAVVVGDPLYPDSDNETEAKKFVCLKKEGNVTHWKALENKAVDKLCRVMFVVSGTDSGGTTVYWAVPTSATDANNYVCDVYSSYGSYLNGDAPVLGAADVRVPYIVDTLAAGDGFPVQDSVITGEDYEAIQQMGAVG